MLELNWEHTGHVQDAPLTREEIDAETDVGTLMQWWQDFSARVIEMKAFSETWHQLGWDDEAQKRYAGKITFARVGQNWVLKRLRELGVDPRPAVQKRIGQIEEKLRKLEEAARKVIKQRDDYADKGTYPFPMEADQAFDDWAADVLEDALI